MNNYVAKVVATAKRSGLLGLSPLSEAPKVLFKAIAVFHHRGQPRFTLAWTRNGPRITCCRPIPPVAKEVHQNEEILLRCASTNVRAIMSTSVIGH